MYSRAMKSKQRMCTCVYIPSLASLAERKLISHLSTTGCVGWELCEQQKSLDAYYQLFDPKWQVSGGTSFQIQSDLSAQSHSHVAQLRMWSRCGRGTVTKSSGHKFVLLQNDKVRSAGLFSLWGFQGGWSHTKQYCCLQCTGSMCLRLFRFLPFSRQILLAAFLQSFFRSFFGNLISSQDLLILSHKGVSPVWECCHT